MYNILKGGISVTVKKRQNTSRKEIAHKEIKKLILLRDLQQGEKVYEDDLAETLEMSRTPIREALMVLERERLVENKGRLGFFVRRVRADEISDYFNVRQILEQYAVPLIVANITDEEIDILEKNVEESEKCFAAGDYRRFVLTNSQFHELLIKAAHSPIVYTAISSLDDISILLRSMASKNQDGMEESLKDHKIIVNTIKLKDAEKLKQVMIDHLEGSKKRNMAFIELIS